MKRPEEVQLSQEEGEALIERVKANRLTEADQRVLVKLIQLYFWLTFALRETKISLGRLKTALFGKGSKKPRSKEDEEGGGAEGGAGDSDSVLANQRPAHRGEGDEHKQRRQGHGRRGADSYSGSQHVRCDHERLSVGERCPVCGRGTLYGLPSGVEIRIDGNALLSAVRYELEKLHGLRHTSSTSCLRQTVLAV